MSNYLAIATVTMVLRKLIEEALADTGISVTVSTQRPAAATGEGASPTRVNVYLYQVTHNPYLGNNDLPTRRSDGTRSERSQVSLNLHYLLSFYGNETEYEPERLLGRVVSTLHAQPQLGRATIRSLVEKSDTLKKSDLADQVELVKLTPLGLNLEEFSKLWSVFFQTTYTLSVAYAASVVLIATEELPVIAKPVATPTLSLQLTGGQPGALAAPPNPLTDVVTRTGTQQVPAAARVEAAKPDTRAGLQLWLQPDAGIEYDEQGRVMVWPDQSGNYNDAKQDESEARPQFVRNVLNGKPVLRFDGKDDRLAIGGLSYEAPDSLDGLTLFAVARSAVRQRQVLVSYDAEEYWSVAMANDQGLITWQTRAPDPGARQDLTSDQSFADGSWHLICVRFEAGAPADKVIFVDGKQVAAADAHGGAKLGTGKHRFGYIGVGSRAATFGGMVGVRDFFQGDLAELALYSRALPEAERRQVEQYFVEKYT